MEKPEEKPKVNISEKIQQTIRERERLQQELQAIIASGIRGPTHSVTPIPATHNLIPESVNKVQIIKSYDPKHSEHVKETPISPTKKPKTYNVEHARGYIKKQKDKRLEELRNRKADTKLAADLKKEKLEELRQKANEIVKKNVESKRARSKSRETPIVRSLSGNRTQRSLSRDNGGSKSRLDPNLLCPPEPVYDCRKIEPKSGKENYEKINKPPVVTKATIPIDAKLSKEKIVIESSNRASRSRLMEPEKNPNLLCPPSPVFSGIQSIIAPKVKENDTKNEMPPPEVPTTVVKSISESVQPLETSVSKKSFHSHSKSDYANKNLNIVSNITLRRSSDNILLLPEPKPANITPEWLQTQPPSSDPYNFINTVKRHLKYAVEEQKPNFVDVGVQGDLDSPKSSKKTDLKSFLSHRYRKDGPATTQLSTSDSDTSKNIPSISSESGTSLRKNAEFIRQSYAISDLKPLTDAPPNLDAKKIEDVRLNDGVNKIRKHLFKDFIEVSPSGKHDSFISGNCAKKSPNRIPPLVIPVESDAKSTNSELNKALQESQPISEVLSTNSENRTSNEGIIIYGNCSKKFRSGISKPKLGELKQKSDFSLGKDSSNSIEGSQKYASLFSTLRPSTEDSDSKKKIQSLSKSSRTAEAYTTFSDDLSLKRKSHRRSTETQSHKNTSSESLDTIKSSLETSKNQELLSDVSLRRSITIRERYREESEKPKNSSFESFTNNITIGMQNSAKEHLSGSLQSIPSEIENPHSSKDLEGSLVSEVALRSSSKDLQDLFKSNSDNLIPKDTSKYRNLLSKSETNICDYKEKSSVPKLSLNIGKTNRKVDNIGKMKNITIRSGDRNCDKFNSAHEIHLKFEAEIDLLTDFNQTIRRFSEIEKTFESLRTEKDNTEMVTKVLQNRDTQTSIASISASKNTTSETKSSKNATVKSDTPTPDNQQLLRLALENQQSLNLTGASNMGFGLTSVNMEDTLQDNTDNTSSIMLKLTQMNFEESPRGGNFVSDENAVFRSVVGMSLKMFDQMIKDEDARIENWKKVVKIREQALLDRTKGELVWLEMQKKQLIETGKLTEASVIKKKQRGIILKHQQERNEMQKLKQMQKQDSQNRKALLKRERNVIKYQMLTDTPSKVKPFSHREKSDRRLSGPFKVIQNSESTTTVHSEASALGTDLEVKSITTRTSMSHSLVNASETFNTNNINKDLEMMDLAVKRGEKANVSTNDIILMKQTLLMREHALAKRRKAVEDLLQWHKKLLDEEKSIENMEKKIGTIISKIPSNKNLLPPESNIPSEVLSTVEPLMAQPADLEKNTQSEESNQATYYSTDFEVDTAPHDSQNSDEQSSISSISQLIGDLGKIEENIMNLMPKESSNKEISETVEESVIFVDEIKSEEEEPISVEPIVTENTASEEFIKESSSEEQNTVEEETISKEPAFINEEAETIEILDETLEEHITDAISEQLESSKSPEPLLQIETIPSPILSPSNEEDAFSPRQNEEIEDIPDPEPSTSHPSGSTQDEDVSEESAEEAEDEHQNKTDEEKVAERGIQSVEETPQASEVSEILSPVANNLEIEEVQISVANYDSNLETSQSEDVASIIEAPSHQEEVVSLDTSNSSYSSDSAVVSSPRSISLVTNPPQTASGSEKSSLSPIDITKSPTDSPKYVDEMLNSPRKDKSPRMQDLWLITDTAFSRETSSDTSSTLDEKRPFLLGNEAEELHRKQLAIEQEIKLLKEQQQKEAASPVYVREIPNKPPPPYTPPFKTKTPKSPSIIPATKDEIEQITEYSAKIIYKAYLSNNLDNISISDNTLNLIAKNIDKGCYKYVFDLCKEVARDHYSQFADDTGPTWMQLDRRITLAPAKPLDVNGLKKLMRRSLLELFGFENQHHKQDNAVMRWSKKKRDHVDQVLVQEMQAEESTWTNFDRDEASIKDRLTNEIMEILLKEAAMVIENAFQKKIESNI